MNYKGTELKEFTSAKPVVFDPPKKMVVWDNTSGDFEEEFVCAYIPARYSKVIAISSTWLHCAEIPEERDQV